MFFAIIPAYNEEQRIAKVIKELLPLVDRVVVVNDASADNTAQVAKDAGAVVLTHYINRGQGAALQTGHEYAKKHQASYILHFDGDGQFTHEDVLPALSRLKESNADILFGSRFLDNRSKIPPFKRHILLPIGKIIDKFVGNPGLSDSHNGFRILTKKALETVVITQDGMAHASQIPQLVKKHNLNVVEFPVKVIYHEYGQSTLGGFHIVKDLFLDHLLNNGYVITISNIF